MGKRAVHHAGVDALTAARKVTWRAIARNQGKKAAVADNDLELATIVERKDISHGSVPRVEAPQVTLNGKRYHNFFID